MDKIPCSEYMHKIETTRNLQIDDLHNFPKFVPKVGNSFINFYKVLRSKTFQAMFHKSVSMIHSKIVGQIMLWKPKI
jgi:hypothetical protein